MTNDKDNMLRSFAHAMTVAATTEALYRGGNAKPRAYVGDSDMFEALAHLHHANVRQQQRIESMRVLEFEAGGVTWVHGVAR